MNLENKSDDQLLALRAETRKEIKQLQTLDRDLQKEYNSRLGLEIIPSQAFTPKRMLSPREVVELGDYLRTSRTPGEIIGKIESILSRRK